MRKLNNKLIILIVFILFSFMTLGYASYGKTLKLNGTLNISKAGILEITNAYIVNSECSNLSSYTNPTYDGVNINFSVTGSNKTFTAVYIVEVTNNSPYEQIFANFAVNPTVSSSSSGAKVVSTLTNASTGATLTAGESLSPGDVFQIKVKLVFTTESSGTTVDVSGDVVAETDNSGNLTATITPTTGSIKSNAIACFTTTVMNTFKYDRLLTFTSSNDNVSLVDSSGNGISTFDISAQSTETYTLCTKASDTAVFLTDSTSTSIVLSSNGVTDITVGTLTLACDIDTTATDHEIPTVGNVTLSVLTSNPPTGEINISWSRIDTGGSDITNYHITLYNTTAGTNTSYDTNSSVTYYTATGLSAGTYYATVYGTDAAGNTGSSSCSSATTSNGYCSKSSSTAFQWVFNVTYDLSGLSYSGATTANLHTSYESTLSVSGDTSRYSLPSSITVTMGGEELESGDDYSFDSSSGSVVINDVTGDITISGSSTGFCLIKGTKIKLANGQYKNVEDITYDDLLMVYDHENGGITYEYPIWIEKETKTNNYQRTTFSDGTILNTYSAHGIFSVDLNKYVSINNINEFNIGTRVLKVNNDGSTSVIYVTNIEYVYEDTTYYNISSTRYHNIIANDLLTTDGSITSSNMFAFDSNAIWTSERDEFLKTNDLFYYYDWLEYFPRYIFEGFRMGEAKILYNKGLLDIDDYSYALNKFINEPNKLNGKNVWKVTTSDNYLSNNYYCEGDYYILPKPINNKNFIGWYNTSDGKMYNIGDRVLVLYGMHFIAKYS